MSQASDISSLIGSTYEAGVGAAEWPEALAQFAAWALDSIAHALLVVDGTARIVLANRAAERLLSLADGIASGPLGLGASAASQTSALRALVAQAAGLHHETPIGGALLLDRPSGKRPLQVQLSPLSAETPWCSVAARPAVALVVVIDPEDGAGAPDAALRALYKLTVAEMRVAQEVADRDGLPAVAEALGISLSTVRTHLQRVFEKTGTRRQAELVRLLERIAIVNEKTRAR